VNEISERDFDTLLDVLEDDAPEAVLTERTVQNFRKMLLVARDTSDENLDVLRLLHKYSNRPPADDEAVTADTIEFVRASRRVCRVEPRNATPCTGFLVAPDMVLTAAHGLVGGTQPIPPGDITCRFDLYVFSGDRQADQVPVGARTDLGDNWIVASSRPSRGSDLPTGEELDYILFRIQSPLGSLSLPRNRRRRRGWMDLSAANVGPIAQSEIAVLQHPNGRLLRFSRGKVSRLAPENGRFFYDNDTDVGSSGGPALNQNKQVVGVHTFARSTGPMTEKEGVNFQAIFADLERQNIRLPRYPPPRR
jgi:V8-like Glu-specific endopeptidase